MTFRASKNVISLRNGRVVTLDHSLVNGMRRPSGGWTAVFRINGVDKSYAARSPQELATQVMMEHRKNNVSLSTADLWLNLNLQWMDRMDIKYFLADRSELESVILQDGQEPDASQRKVFPPEVWGSRAWNWLALLLAADDYVPEVFLLHCEQVLKLLSPVATPSLGCISCFSEWSEDMRTIRLNPPQTREDARQWLWSMHNKVSRKIGKPALSYERAKTLNWWL